MANDLEQRADEILAKVCEGDEETVAYLCGGLVPIAKAREAIVAALQQAQQPGAQAVAIEPEPDLDAHDPKSGELVAQWLFRNGFRELAAVVRAQLDMRAPRKATPPLPEGVSEEDAKAALAAMDAVLVELTGLYGVEKLSDDHQAELLQGIRAALENFLARLAAKGGAA